MPIYSMCLQQNSLNNWLGKCQTISCVPKYIHLGSTLDYPSILACSDDQSSKHLNY